MKDRKLQFCDVTIIMMMHASYYFENPCHGFKFLQEFIMLGLVFFYQIGE